MNTVSADTTPDPVPVVLDCDPGHDDAFAILLAYAHPRINLLAITTVAGNQTLPKCTLNARRVCTVAGIDDVPLASGSPAPLSRPLQVADDIHGPTGLDGPEWPEPTVEVASDDAVHLTYDILSRHADPVTVIATGPLTNVAQLLRRHPDAAARIEQVVLMGGSTARGNASPYAEFNIFADPEAADEVFRSEVEVTMVGLNVTHQAQCSAHVREWLRSGGGRVARVCDALLEFYGARYRHEYGMGGPPLHDPVAVARVIDPTVVECVRAPVVVETSGRYTSGATVVDLHHRLGVPDNAWVATGLDVPRFWDLVAGAVGTYR